MITEEDYDTEDLEGADDFEQDTDGEDGVLLNLKQVNEDDEDGYTGTSEELSDYDGINIGKLEDRYKATEMYQIVK